MGKYTFSLVPDVFEYDHQNVDELNEKRATMGKDPKPPLLTVQQKTLGLKEKFDNPSSADEIDIPPWARIPTYVKALNETDKYGACHKVIYSGYKIAYQKEVSLETLEKAFKEAGDPMSPYLKKIIIAGLTSPGAKIRLHDARLLEEEEAQNLRGLDVNDYDVGDFPVPDAMLTSPSERCLKTTERVYRKVVEDHGGEGRTFQPVVWENLREKRNGDACNYRSSKSDIMAEHPDYILQEGFAEDDPHESDIERAKNRNMEKTESDSDLEERMRQVLDDIFDDDKTSVVSLTTHSFSIGALTKVLGFPCTLREGNMAAFLVKASPLETKEPEAGRGKGGVSPPFMQSIG
ncbi:hypothetical protein PG999_014638 [Apiospora kogelbergensis]|uniref:Uncharacterized protein n=1 Tax=Apiospora kogelbergensis TaxID=1337665 RepID=A0AAW0Q4T7_9PEZI